MCPLDSPPTPKNRMLGSLASRLWFFFRPSFRHSQAAAELDGGLFFSSAFIKLKGTALQKAACQATQIINRRTLKHSTERLHTAHTEGCNNARAWRNGMGFKKAFQHTSNPSRGGTTNLTSCRFLSTKHVCDARLTGAVPMH